jgi:hypothetical protein
MVAEYTIFIAIIVMAIGVAVLALTSLAALLIYVFRRSRGEQ